jgi:hypothetical protein
LRRIEGVFEQAKDHVHSKKGSTRRVAAAVAGIMSSVDGHIYTGILIAARLTSPHRVWLAGAGGARADFARTDQARWNHAGLSAGTGHATQKPLRGATLISLGIPKLVRFAKIRRPRLAGILMPLSEAKVVAVPRPKPG